MRCSCSPLVLCNCLAVDDVHSPADSPTCTPMLYLQTMYCGETAPIALNPFRIYYIFSSACRRANLYRLKDVGVRWTSANTKLDGISPPGHQVRRRVRGRCSDCSESTRVPSRVGYNHHHLQQLPTLRGRRVRVMSCHETGSLRPPTRSDLHASLAGGSWGP